MKSQGIILLLYSVHTMSKRPNRLLSNFILLLLFKIFRSVTGKPSDCFMHFKNHGIRGLLPFHIELVSDYRECIDECIKNQPHCQAAVISPPRTVKIQEKLCDLYTTERPAVIQTHMVYVPMTECFIAVQACITTSHPPPETYPPSQEFPSTFLSSLPVNMSSNSYISSKFSPDFTYKQPKKDHKSLTALKPQEGNRYSDIGPTKLWLVPEVIYDNASKSHGHMLNQPKRIDQYPYEYPEKHESMKKTDGLPHSSSLSAFTTGQQETDIRYTHSPSSLVGNDGVTPQTEQHPYPYDVNPYHVRKTAPALPEIYQKQLEDGTGIWLPWSEWTQCTTGTTCKSAKERIRVCQQGNKNCEGLASEVEPCDCFAEWFQWGPWAPCSAECGTGAQYRSRRCSQPRKCLGESMENRLCQTGYDCVQHWSDWGSWSSCSAPCGPGRKVRHRLCNGSNPCTGPASEHILCLEQDCAKSQWSQWSSWLKCNVSCGRGHQTRRRICAGFESSCRGRDRELRICHGNKCWSDWNPWSQCNSSCGHGNRHRHRTCLSETECYGEAKQSQPCNAGSCPRWAQWESWSPCSHPCGPGVHTRIRKCSSSSKYGCRGPYIEQASCSIQNCVVWSPWGHWGACSASCSLGRRHRHRTCSDGTCLGPSVNYEDCNAGICPQWSPWSQWSLCTATCGTGKAFRERFCQGGLVCDGHALEHTTCSPGACSQYDPCNWGEWQQWGLCSTTCGTGIRTRSRICICSNNQAFSSCVTGSNMQMLLCQDRVTCL